MRLVVRIPPVVLTTRSCACSRQDGGAARQNVVVDNRGGGNTIIGSELVAKAVPDGIRCWSSCGSRDQSRLYASAVHTARDFAPVTLVGDGAYVLVAHRLSGVASTRNDCARRGKPGQIAYASSSIGNLTHLAAELFMRSPA